MLITSWLRSVQTRLILNRRRSMRRRPERDSRSSEKLEDRTLLAAPTLVAVQPNIGEFLARDEIRNVAPQQLTLQFNPGQQIDPGTLGAITVTRSGFDDDFDNGEVDVPIGFVGIGDVPEEVVVRFAENLSDDQYRINIDGESTAPLMNLNGEVFNDGADDFFPFELDLGAQVVAVVPQPISRDGNGPLSQKLKDIIVYFNDDELSASAMDPSFYSLIFTNDTITNADDESHNPDEVVYDSTANTATLTFDANIHTLSGAGTYRLRIGTAEDAQPDPIEFVTAADPGSSYRDADTSIGDLSLDGRTSQVISSAIDPEFYPFEFPGAHDEPGHREIEQEAHLHGPADTTPGITTIPYNFQNDYGFDPLGNPLSNLITETQKTRAREVFAFYSNYAGLDFVETDALGFTIVTGDPRAVDPTVPTGPGGVIGIAGDGLAVMDNAETWDDSRGGNWFETAMHEIGHLLGLGHTYDLPSLTVQGSESNAGRGPVEPDFPGDGDIVHARHLFRPDSNDIDLYQFEVNDAGLFTAEVIAERRANSTNLDSQLRLFRVNTDGPREMVAQNDDYYSEDSYIELSLEPGTYYIGVSASGNNDYDPTIAGTGIGGTSQGEYDLRLNYRPNVDDTIVDSTGIAFDGDRDGLAGGVENFWFRAVTPARTLIVDKVAAPGGDGSLATPYNQIDVAFANANPGDIVRIVGNAGADEDIATIDDNFAYQIGFDLSSTPQALIDGSTADVPAGVTTMIDAGALLKFHRARIGVGSPNASVDHSGAALQVLGIPGTEVIMTSWLDETVGNDTTPTPTTAGSGNWGGLMFQNDVDNEEARFNYENEGIFLNYVSHGNLQFGGGSVVVNSQARTVNPIHMTQARPTILNNRILFSADSAMSADPDSFEETNFHSPRYQGSDLFTQDYDRIGPDVYGNILVGNSTNGLFVRVETSPGAPTNKLTVPGRFNDPDIVHVITGNLEIEGTPGGAFLDATSPSVILVKLTELTSGGSLTAGTYNYRMVFVDAVGNESPASDMTRDVTVTTATSRVFLENLPPAPSPFVGRRLYRSDAAGVGPYQLIANLDISDTDYIDDGTNLVGELNPTAAVQRSRTDARLAIDPGTIVKLEQAVIEVGVGATFLAEGDLGREIIVTSRRDDRYGAGGTFDTNDDDDDAIEAQPGPGDWGGIYLGHLGHGSIDHALITFGGGETPLEGDFAAFNVLEIHQARARVTNTVFEHNADGQGGTAPASRFGRLANASSTIFVRGAQPILVGNTIRDGEGPAISINTNALNHELVRDPGRSIGMADRIVTYADNQGPLVRTNLLGRNAINGMEVRGETLTTQGVWDDPDIVHVLRSEIYIPDFHTFGGLRLESSSDASLVVKLSGADAGITANGRPLDIDDRIGGTVQIIGQPFRPVVLTSLSDDEVGAGFGLDGLPLRDTNNDGNSIGLPGDWRSIRIDQFANDRNSKIVVENETANELSPDTNGGISNAEFLGVLGEHEKDSDETLRLGFEVSGAVSRAEDVDVYSFDATAGTEIWIDLDRTRHALDGVVELLDGNGQIIAQSDNSHSESIGEYAPFTGIGNPNVNQLEKSVHINHDRYTTNQRDAGMRVVLPGTVGTEGTFYVRVRSSNIDSLDPASDRTDLQDSSKLNDGLTFGAYHLQIRLGEVDEVTGSTIRYSDIRFATRGIEVFGQPVHTPLAGELAETEGNDTQATANDAGNVFNSDRAALAFSGVISAEDDLDWFEFDVTVDSIQTISDFTNPNQHVPVVFDLDYADGLSRANTSIWIYDENGTIIYAGQDSNVSEDRPAPLNGADIDDLSRGTVGPLDAYIGPVELRVGKYYMVVTSNERVPVPLQHYFGYLPDPSAGTLEPINTVDRISEEHFGLADSRATAGQPLTDLFTVVNGPNGPTLGGHHTDFHLGDVPVFVSAPGMAGAQTGIYLVDAFTGDQEGHVGQFNPGMHDIAMRPDGDLYGFTISPFPGDIFNDDNVGHYTEIDTGDGSVQDLENDDGITTWTAATCRPPMGVQQANVGMDWQALMYRGTDVGDGLVVGGNRALADHIGGYGVNALYQFNIVSGGIISQSPIPRLGNQRACDGAGTQFWELGQIDAFGVVTGMAQVDGEVYAVDDVGFLYHLELTYGLPKQGVVTTLIAQITDENGDGVPFSGLAVGPGPGTENGLYEEMLFGISGDTQGMSPIPGGLIFAFNTLGETQPVLLDGQISVDTGIRFADGLDFGTLDYNAWQVATAGREADAGHGIVVPPDGSRLAEDGDVSLYFGNTAAAADAGNKNELSTTAINDVNFPGGAHGDVMSNPFSLVGYDANDKPSLYFNYFLETDGGTGNQTTDSFRVYVGGDETFIDPLTGEMTKWSLVGTNNTLQGEFDHGVGVFPTDFPDAQNYQDVRPLYHNTDNWISTKVDLSNFAGMNNLQLRFVFSTAGTLNIGGNSLKGIMDWSAGEELFALPGSELRDGNTFAIDGIDFEFDLGFTMLAPTGSVITEGDTFTIDGITFELDSDNAAGAIPVPYAPHYTADAVAQSMLAAIQAEFGLGLTATLNGNRLNLSDAATLTQTGSILIEGAPGATVGVPIPIHSAMTRSEVADQMKIALAAVFASGSVDAIQGTEDKIELIGHTITDPGVLPAANMLPGDQFGFPDSAFAGPITRGQNNAVNGVYVDDIVIGFAERGEMVAGASANTNFVENLINLGDLEILEGPYDVEIRRAAEFGMSQEDDPNLLLFRSIDTNERVTTSTSLLIPDAGMIADGDTFSISDGDNTVVFEFEDIHRGNGVEQGHVEVLFNTRVGVAGDQAAESSSAMAERVRDAVNSQAVQGILDIVAGLSNGLATGVSTSSIVNLYGNVIVDVERPSDVFGVVGTINNVPALNSDNLFSFENVHASEQISSISLTLPDGFTFDPDPGDAGSGPDGPSGPNVGADSDDVGETFRFNIDNLGRRNNVEISFSGFESGEFFEFGVDIDPSDDPADYIGTRYEIMFDSGRVVRGFFQNTQDLNPAEHDDIIDPGSRDEFIAVLAASVVIRQFDDFGDPNNFRDQGQILIEQNSIVNSGDWGIFVDAGVRSPGNIPLGGDIPHQGSVRNLRELNTENLVPGLVISNNVVARGGTGGISFTGDTGTDPVGPLPFGRLVNNTIVGLDREGTGIYVDNAAPTLINNIVSELRLGISIEPNSRATSVIGATLYHNNRNNIATGPLGLGSFPIILNASDPLFIDAPNGNYYPAPQSQAIDSSLDILGDRTDLIRVKDPLGISVSPILTPDLDVFGQKRGDDPDVSPPSGLGPQVFKDRGAIDRVDFFQPVAILANPEDGAVNDLDPDADEVWINEPDFLRQFIVEMSDEGIGIDDSSISSAGFKLYQDGVELIDGTDYVFTYNSNTKQAIFTSVTTYEFERAYRIEIDNDDPAVDGDLINGVRDLAGNYLAANQTDGTTQFFILVTDGFNDPPENSVPADQLLPEDLVFSFNAGDGTEITVSDPDVHLGNNELRITLTTANGTLTLGDTAGLTFEAGDGVDDAVMTFTGDVADLNAAMEGMEFTPDAEFFGTASVTIVTEDQGQFSGPPSPNQSDTDTIDLEYFQINDAPTFELPGNPPASVIEDAGPQLVPGFADNIDAGAPNESGQMLDFVFTLVSVTGNLSFVDGPDIDPSTGDLSYTTSPHTNGLATYRVVLMDDGAGTAPDDNTSDPQLVTFTVDPINDEPVFNFLAGSDPPAVDEDSGEHTVSGYLTDIAPGPPEATDELGQVLTLDVQVLSTTGNLAFTRLEIDPNTGDLVYEAAPDTAGLGLISVTLFDDGPGAPAPNDNVGPTRQFTIRVNPIDDPPVASSPDYVIDHGDTLMLDGSGSTDPDIPLGDSLTYHWDLDNDGQYDDATGESPSISFSQLVGFGFDVPDVRTIGLRVVDAPDGSGNSREDTTTATVTVLAVDYGDLINSYGTRKPGGAAHTIFPGFHLGALVDSDVDGQNTSNAAGDDNDGIDDEDGIVFHTTLETTGSQALVSPFTVSVTAPFAGKLDGWIDFNNNGTFEHPAEHISGGVSYDVFDGVQVLDLMVPAGAATGLRAARFRLSTSGGLLPTGRVGEGEVEDYRVSIIDLQSPVVPDFTSPAMRTIDRTPTFTWTEDTANTSYRFQLFDPDGNLIEDRQNVIGNEFTIGADLPYGAYEARVAGVNRAGDASAYSAAYEVQVIPEAPIVQTPNGDVLDSTPTFSWTTIVDVEGYRLEVDNLTSGENQVILVDVATNVYTATTDLPLGNYRVRVRAFGGDVLSDYSPDHSIALRTPPELISPDTLTFDETPTITWEAPAGADTYQVRVRINGQSTNLVNVTGVTDTSYTLTEPLPFGTYRVLIRATADGDPTFWSEVTNEKFRVVLTPELLGPGGQILDNSPTVEWSGINGGETYELRIHNLTTGENNVVRVGDIAGLSYTVDELPIGKYRASVRAKNPFNQLSPWSAPKDFSIVTRPVALTPTGSFFDKEPVFTWDAIEGADRYEVRVHKLLSGSDPGDPDGKILNFIREEVDGLALGAPYNTSRGLRLLMPNAGYRFWVRGIAGTGGNQVLTKWSEPLQFVVGGRPTLDGVGNTSDRTPTFTWTAIPDAEKYTLRIRRVSDNEQLLLRKNLGGTSFELENPLPRGTYRAWLRAISPAGKASPWSFPVTFTITDLGEFALIADDPTEAPETNMAGEQPAEFVTTIDMPLVAEPVIDVTDPQIEIINETPVPFAAPQQELPASSRDATDDESAPAIDSVLAAWDQVDPALLDAEERAIAASDDRADAALLGAGLLGGLFGGGLVKRRRKSDSRKRN